MGYFTFFTQISLMVTLTIFFLFTSNFSNINYRKIRYIIDHLYILSCFPDYFLFCLFVPQFLNEEINIFVGTVYIVIPVEGTRGIANMTDRRAGHATFF